MQADVDAAGGFYTTPEQFVKRLIKAVDDQTFIRTWATVESVTQAQSLGLPYLAANPADADWTSELGTGDEDSTMAFGKRELSPKPLAKRIKVSNKLLRLSPDVESLVIERLAYKFGITYEKACLTGSGAGQPLGLFVASADGIPTTRDVATGNATTAIQTDGLIEAKYTLKATYWPRAKWLFHRDAIKQLAKLQNDDGDYLWQPSVQMGQPDMLFGVPVFASEYVPNTFTTGQYVGMIGDFSLYHIVDALDFSVQRLNELYAANNQTGFIGRMESDGMPVLAEAFVRVKLA
jgi:HK97 family phage major capsid protein